jgi:hypothetical protein
VESSGGFAAVAGLRPNNLRIAKITAYPATTPMLSETATVMTKVVEAKIVRTGTCLKLRCTATKPSCSLVTAF